LKKINFTPVEPLSNNQAQYEELLNKNEIIFCKGHAGTGKTLMALSKALELINSNHNRYKRLVIIRPYIPNNIGEKLGSLPGELDEKVRPYLEGIKDNLRKLIPCDADIERLFREKTIELTVLSMCRGRSFNNCVVLVNEAQNCPINGESLKMLLTRIGVSTKMIIEGDCSQSDLYDGDSAFEEAFYLLKGIRGIGFVEMNDYSDIQRNPLVREILKRYDKR
jgi:phosphate starvation-inducible PhoH-like protein